MGFNGIVFKETITNLFEMPYNFKPEYEGGILEEDCAGILKEFFKKLRN